MASNSRLMDEAALKQWILRRLGAPFLKIELTDIHLADAIESARRWFAAHKGIQKTTSLQIMAGQTEYELPDEVDAVEDVVPMAPAMDLSLVFAPFTMMDDRVPYDVFANTNTGGLYSTITQTLQYVETAKRILGAEPDWRQEGRLLYIFPIPRSSGTILLNYKSSDITIEQLAPRDHDMLKRYALACAKEDVGCIRSKYTDFPTAQGTATLDGERLLEEAATAKEALDQEIALSSFPMGFMTG